jgi:alpha-L-fucosidase
MKQLFFLLPLLAASALLHGQWSVISEDPENDPRGKSVLYQIFTQEAWNASNFADESDLEWFRDAKFGMFVHFGLSAYKEKDLSWGICQTRALPDQGEGPYPTEEWTKWKDKMALPEFDAEALVQYAIDAGMRYIVVIAKHHDGFHMWDTAYSDFKITNTPFGRDYLKEIADACHAADMKFGVYYSQRDWYHPDYMPVDPAKSERVPGRPLSWRPKPGESDTMGASHQEYIDYQFNVCRELATKYGKLDIFWFDALYWGGMFSAGMWESERLTRMIRELQPGILINNRASLPGDFDTPEQKVGSFQTHRPWESCITLCGTWAYSDTRVRPPKEVIRLLVDTICGDGNLLLSWGALWSGAFDPEQIATLRETGTWVKQHSEAIFDTRGGPWKPANWGGSVHRGEKVYLHITAPLPNDTLKLDGLRERVLAARIHKGEPVDFTQTGKTLEMRLPESLINPYATVVELTLDGPVDDIIDAEADVSMFQQPAYGEELQKTGRIRLSPNQPASTIDLGRLYSVTGLQLNLIALPDSGPPAYRVYTSVDGEHWDIVDHEATRQRNQDIPIMRYEAGAFIPGKTARFLKIEKPESHPGSLRIQDSHVFGLETD